MRPLRYDANRQRLTICDARSPSLEYEIARNAAFAYCPDDETTAHVAELVGRHTKRKRCGSPASRCGSPASHTASRGLEVHVSRDASGSGTHGASSRRLRRRCQGDVDYAVLNGDHGWGNVIGSREGKSLGNLQPVPLSLGELCLLHNDLLQQVLLQPRGRGVAGGRMIAALP